MKTDYKSIFLKQLADARVQLPDQTEYRFMMSRNWAFDWAYKDLKIAIEYQGMPLQIKKSSTVHKSGHNSIIGQTRDWHKFNMAALRGWLVICINAKMVSDGEAVWYVQQAIRTRKEGLTYKGI